MRYIPIIFVLSEQDSTNSLLFHLCWAAEIVFSYPYNTWGGAVWLGVKVRK